MGVEGPFGDVRAGPVGPFETDPSVTLASEADRAREREAWAVLAGVDGLGPLVFSMLLRRIGTGRAILDHARRGGGALALVAAAGERLPDEGPVGPVLSSEVAAAIAAASTDAARTLDRIDSLGLRIVTVDDADYPARLAAVDLPPHVLFVRGSTAALHGVHAVAVVGTRRASTGGRALAARLAGALVSSDAEVVSGLAIGIDGAAHAATLAAGGRTVAVIGTGHAHLYPRAHTRLARAIVEGGGAIVSELVPDTGPKAWTFPRRNRLISGLADATVVVEAPARSGALLTASWSMEQGRDCFLVPGPIDSAAHAGCLAFLREFPGSARIVSGVPQLIEDLGLAAAPVARGATRLASATLAEIGGTAALIGRELVGGRVTVDELVAVTGLPVATVLATLTMLERRGLVAGAFGRYRPAGTLALAGSRAGQPRRRRPGTTS